MNQGNTPEKVAVLFQTTTMIFAPELSNTHSHCSICSQSALLLEQIAYWIIALNL